MLGQHPPAKVPFLTAADTSKAIFNTSATVKFTTLLPSSIPSHKAIATLQDHHAFIKCDPHLVSFKPLASPSVSPPPSSRACSPPTSEEPKAYEVVDRVRALPAGLWDSDVHSTSEIVNLERGIFVRMRSPLSIVMETVWEIREVEGGEVGAREMVEESVISCSRFLAGVVKGQCEANWKGIHARLLRIMKGEGEA